MIKETELLTSKEMRENCVNRLEVLDKVGDLLLLSNTEYATTSQVATYYGVTTRHIEDLVSNNKEELISDGFGLKNANSFISELNFGNKVTKQRGKFLVEINDGEILTFAPRGVNLFPKRAILRIGMLLRDSKIAKEIRTKLLDVVYDAQSIKTDNGNTIIENIVDEIGTERELILQKVEAEMKGDYPEVSVINAKLFALKNKRISELEKEVETITTHSLTIIESRSVINRLVRKIGAKEYNAKFYEAWNELWSKVNYKLHTNVKARKEKPLDSFSESEMFQVEEIVRTWANDCGIDVVDALTLAS